MKEKIEKINPNSFISNLLKSSYEEAEQIEGIIGVSHITYNPNVNEEYQYRVIEHGEHDGTVLFTLDNIDRCLTRLIKKQTYYKPLLNGKKAHEVKEVSYEIGDIEVKSIYGINIGVEETISIPVRCSLIFK